ncbi:MAG: T9SS type A sorting domain-containing protein [Chitinophagales bacterium]|nr:T9SS type A sorting domain-containing protein [Chitinophagales bacterium]
MRKTLLLTVFSIFYSLGGLTQLHAQCTQERYREPIFDDITITKDVKYGENINNLNEMQDLKMNIFRPSDDDDSLRKRPVIIMLHGGAYVAGTKDEGTMGFMGENLAKRGYVVVPIQYRLELGQTDLPPILQFADKMNWYKAIIRSVQDVKGAIRYLKHTYAEEGNPYGIDTNNITLYGSSAGAIGIIHATYMDENDNYNLAWTQAIKALGGLEGNTTPYLQYGSINTVKNLIIDSGAITEIEWIGDKNDIDVLSLHNINDPTVPYRHGCFYMAACHLGRFYGAFNYVPVMRNNGTYVVAVALDKAEHPVDDNNPQFALEQAVNFLYDAQCKYENSVPTGIFQQNVQKLNIYPNPNKGSFGVELDHLSKNNTLQIFSLSGQLVFEKMIHHPKEQFDTHLPKGVYFIAIQDEIQKSVSKLVIE